MFNSLLNYLCYFIIFLILAWDKIYFIFIKKGNEMTNYYIFQKHEQCTIHNSTSCGCKLDIPQKELMNTIRNRIDIYKICTSYFKIVDNKLTFVNVETKQQFINIKTNMNM